jgi:acetyl esterase
MAGPLNVATPASPSSELPDPAVAALLVSIKEQGFPGWAYLTIEQGRAMLATMRPLAGEPEPVARVEDVAIPGRPDTPARMYLPQGDRPLTVVVYFHAGGLGAR